MVVPSFDENVMPHLDTVFLVHEADDAVTDFASLTRWENVFQDLDNTLTQFRCKSLKDQVWVALRDGSASSIGNIGSKDDVVQRETDCWAMREMRNCHRRGISTVFVEEDHVRHRRCICAGH